MRNFQNCEELEMDTEENRELKGKRNGVKNLTGTKASLNALFLCQDFLNVSNSKLFLTSEFF